MIGFNLRLKRIAVAVSLNHMRWNSERSIARQRYHVFPSLHTARLIRILFVVEGVSPKTLRRARRGSEASGGKQS